MGCSNISDSNEPADRGSNANWSEEDSTLYRRLASIAVPDRVDQVATLLCLIPFSRDEAFRVVELGSGEGRLAWSVLEAFPGAHVHALDGSESMREETRARTQAFAQRIAVSAFDLLADDWHGHLDGVDVVMASLSVHHLDAAGKQRLFREAVSRMSERGSILLADVVEPPNPIVSALFADAYDVVAERQSLDETSGRDAFEAFVRDEWNIFRFAEQGEIPSPLFDQLQWLTEAGYAQVAPVWQQAGHAIYAGYKGPEDVSPQVARGKLAPGRADARLSFAEALVIAREALASASTV